MPLHQKHIRGSFIIISIAILSVGTFLLYRNTKKKYAQNIIAKGGHDYYGVIVTFDEPFLKIWSDSLNNNQKTFQYNGKLYNSIGGKVQT